MKKQLELLEKLEELSYEPNTDAYSASLNEMEEIAKIISKDKNLIASTIAMNHYANN